jgi:hypothetical protein
VDPLLISFAFTYVREEGAAERVARAIGQARGQVLHLVANDDNDDSTGGGGTRAGLQPALSCDSVQLRIAGEARGEAAPLSDSLRSFAERERRMVAL